MKQSHEREDVVYALAAIGNPAAWAQLRDMLADAAPSVREAVATALNDAGFVD